MNERTPEHTFTSHRSMEALFERALTVADEDDVWEAIHELRSIATEAVFVEDASQYSQIQ